MKVILWIVGIVFVLWFLSSSSNSKSTSSTYTSGRYDENVLSEEDEKITSDNWECTDDCRGHEAGYEWAADKGISDPDDCGGNSDSFIEGCEAYANEQTMENNDYEEDYDPLY